MKVEGDMGRKSKKRQESEEHVGQDDQAQADSEVHEVHNEVQSEAHVRKTKRKHRKRKVKKCVVAFDLHDVVMRIDWLAVFAMILFAQHKMFLLLLLLNPVFLFRMLRYIKNKYTNEHWLDIMQNDYGRLVYHLRVCMQHVLRSLRALQG